MRRPFCVARGTGIAFGLAALVFFASACASTDDSSALADEIVASIDQPVTVVVESEDCTRTVVIDEYGFETETTVCAPVQPEPEGVDPEEVEANTVDASVDADALLAGDAVLPLELFTTLVSDVPDGGLRLPLGALSLLLDDLDVLCGVDPEGWTAGVETAAAEIGEIAMLFESAVDATTEDASADDDVAVYLGSPSARLLARALLERTLLLTGCANTPAASLPSVSGAALRMNAATAAVATSVEHLGRVLRDSTTDPLFFHPDELAHLRWMRSSDESVEFVVAGTSQATHGISPTQLSEASGRVVASVAIPGSVAEVQQYWLPTVMEAVDPATVIWAIGAVDLVVGCPDGGLGETFADGAARRAASFQRIGWLDDVPPVSRILGPVGNEVYLETPIGELAANRYPENRRGEAVRLMSISELAIEESRPAFAPALELGAYCEDRADLIRSIIGSLQADGRDIVLVGMPISPDLVPSYPGGSEALTQVMERFRSEVADPSGVPLFDLTGSIQEAQYWSDWVHPVAEGSVLFTADIAAALAEAGVW